MKRLMALLLILSLVTMVPLMSACKNDNVGDDAAETTADDIEQEPIEHKVGYIYYGSVRNSTHNLIMENSRIQLEKNLGVETYFIEDVFVKNFMDAVELLIEYGVTIIVSTSQAFENVAERAATENKSVQFISFGNSSTRMNLTAFQPLLYQPANICGLAAAYNSESDSLGVVVDDRMFNSGGVVNAYLQGAREVRTTNLVTYVNYASSESDSEVRAAIDDLVAKGNDVIMLYLSTDYGIRYCEQIGVKVVAFSRNLPELAPNNYITGFFFNLDSYITEQVRFIQNDAFFPITTFGVLDTGHVQMIKLNDNVNEGTSKLTDFLYDALTKNDRVFVGKISDIFGNTVVEHGITLSFRDVLNIKWLDSSATDRVGKFTEPLADVVLVPLVVKGTAIDD